MGGEKLHKRSTQWIQKRGTRLEGLCVVHSVKDAEPGLRGAIFPDTLRLYARGSKLSLAKAFSKI